MTHIEPTFISTSYFLRSEQRFWKFKTKLKWDSPGSPRCSLWGCVFRGFEVENAVLLTRRMLFHLHGLLHFHPPFQTDHRLPWRTRQYLLGLLFLLQLHIVVDQLLPLLLMWSESGLMFSRAVFFILVSVEPSLPLSAHQQSNVPLCLGFPASFSEADYILFAAITVLSLSTNGNFPQWESKTHPDYNVCTRFNF